mgnify:CR=1 FL=1
MDTERAERIGLPRVERGGVVGENAPQRAAQARPVPVGAKVIPGHGEKPVRARDLRVGGIVHVDVAENVHPSVQGGEPHGARLVLRDHGTRAIGDEQVEGVVGFGIDGREGLLGRNRRLGRKYLHEEQAARAPAWNRWLRDPPIQQAGDDAVLGDAEPGAPGLQVAPADDARPLAQDEGCTRRPFEKLVTVGGHHDRNVRELPHVDGERAHCTVSIQNCVGVRCMVASIDALHTRKRTEHGMFHSIEEVVERFAGQHYICSRTIATVVYLASHLRKPILVEGPAGVGKTELAKVLAGALGHELIRLQCYEGLDEAKALYEWEYAKQLLYTQILKDKIGEVIAGTSSLKEAVERITAQEDVFFSERFILPRPLLRAISAPHPCVLLIDEIDKADTEFEAFLLEVLSDFQVSVPELGTLKARHVPLVILTSNNAREMSDALKRRCLHLYIDFPDREQERTIVMLKVPGIAARLADELVGAVQAVRTLDLKKAPSISETLDWARALMLLNIDTLDGALVNDTLSTILKYEGDIRKAQQELKAYVARHSAKAPPPAAPVPKDVLH